MSELRELGALLDAAPDGEALEEAIRTAIQALLFHQVIYDDTHTVPGAAIEAVKQHRAFFEKYFSAAGFRLVIDNKTQMLALQPIESDKPPYGWRQTRLKKDDTLLRLALRHIFEAGFVNGSMDEAGRVPTDTNELTDLFKRLAKSSPPSESQLLDVMLRELQRKGAVRIGDRDKDARVTQLKVLPGIRVMVPDEFIERVERWLDAGAEGQLLEKAK